MIIVPHIGGTESLGELVQAHVLKVFDGDGFLARIWDPYRKLWMERVACRLAFIDAPELDQPFGQESRHFLTELIADKPLGLCTVLKGSRSQTFIDPYHRLLCSGYLNEEMEVGAICYYLNGRSAVGHVQRARRVTRNIELEMVVNGWAWVNEIYAFYHAAEYYAAQDDARRSRRGLWAGNQPEAPWTFKRRKRLGAKGANAQLNLI